MGQSGHGSGRGLEGIFFDDEEYRFTCGSIRNDGKYAASKTVTQIESSGVYAATPCDARRSSAMAKSQNPRNDWQIGRFAVPAGAMFTATRTDGRLFLHGFVCRRATRQSRSFLWRTLLQPNRYQFQLEKFLRHTLTQSPQSPRLMPSNVYSTWTNNAPLSFASMTRTVGTPAMTYSVLRQTHR